MASIDYAFEDKDVFRFKATFPAIDGETVEIPMTNGWNQGVLQGVRSGAAAFTITLAVATALNNNGNPSYVNNGTVTEAAVLNYPGSATDPADTAGANWLRLTATTLNGQTVAVTGKLIRI